MDTNNSFKLKRERAFRCGTTVFTAPAGAVVRVLRADTVRNKVLIEFDDRLCDWFHRSVMSDFVHVQGKEVE